MKQDIDFDDEVEMKIVFQDLTSKQARVIQNNCHKSIDICTLIECLELNCWECPLDGVEGVMQIV